MTKHPLFPKDVTSWFAGVVKLASLARARGEFGPDGEPFVSDNGLWIWDADFGKITDPAGLERRIKEIPGVLENGLFTHPVWKVLVAGKGGVKEA